jgi:V/A-type H+-transporting ATPase subunit C
MAVTKSYAYAVGRVRVLENRLLDRSQIHRMAEAKGAKEALQVLGETEYGSLVAELDSVYDYENLLEKELNRIYQLVRGFYPDPLLVEIFALKYDVHNLKVMLKAYFQKDPEAVEDLLITAGNIPLEQLRAMFQSEDFSSLEPVFREAVHRLKEEFFHGPDPQRIDIVLDGAMYEYIRQRVEKWPFLGQYFRQQVDLLNIKTFFRVRGHRRDWNFLSQVLLPGGSIEGPVFRRYLEEPLEEFSEEFKMSPYGTIVQEGVREWQEKGNLAGFEKMVADFQIEFLKRTKYMTFGPEPLVGYLLAKENELTLLRIIMVGKLNHLPTEEIRERLRDTYV